VPIIGGAGANYRGCRCRRASCSDPPRDVAVQAEQFIETSVIHDDHLSPPRRRALRLDLGNSVVKLVDRVNICTLLARRSSFE